LFLIFILLALQTVAHMVVPAVPGDWVKLATYSSIAMWLIWFVVLFLMVMPSTDRWLTPFLKRLKWAAVIIGVVLVLIGIVEIVGVNLLETGRIETELKGLQTADALRQRLGYSDGTALIHAAGEELIEGENPYSGVDVYESFDRFGISANEATPLRQGEFEDAWPYPKGEDLESVWQEREASEEVQPAEFETRVSYPAGSFLFAAPLLAVGLDDFRYFYVTCAILMFGVMVWWSGKEMWPLVLLVAASNLVFWNDIAVGGHETLYLLFLLVGWLTLRKNLWLSASFIGLAAASKQLAWFFIPFYLILLLRTIGLKRCVQATAVVAGFFLVVNAAFIADDPSNWFKSVFAPLIDPMFPGGVGLVNLSLAGLVPASDQLVYAVAEVLVLGLGMVWYYFNCRRYPHAGLVLAVLPCFFAWRSCSRYIHPAAILAFAAVMADWIRQRSDPESAIEESAPAGNGEAAAT